MVWRCAAWTIGAPSRAYIPANDPKQTIIATAEWMMLRRVTTAIPAVVKRQSLSASFTSLSFSERAAWRVSWPSMIAAIRRSAT